MLSPALDFLPCSQSLNTGNPPALKVVFLGESIPLEKVISKGSQIWDFCLVLIGLGPLVFPSLQAGDHWPPVHGLYHSLIPTWSWQILTGLVDILFPRCCCSVVGHFPFCSHPRVLSKPGSKHQLCKDPTMFSLLINIPIHNNSFRFSKK